MRTLKGYGKNYFSLSAICAYSSSTVLHAQSTAFIQSSKNLVCESSVEEDDPLEDLELLILEDTLTTSSSYYLRYQTKDFLFKLFLNYIIYPLNNFITFKNPLGTSPP